MTAKRTGEALSIWVITSVMFAALLMVSFFVVGLFGPNGDAAFGFSLGLTPSLGAFAITYLVFSCWVLFSSRKKDATFEQKLQYFGLRAAIAGGISGTLVVLNAAIVYYTFFVH